MIIKWFKILFSSLMLAALLSGQGTKKDTPPAAPAPSTAKKAPKAVNAADQCQAKTQAGGQCKRKASPGSKFCWQHGGKKADTSTPKKT